MKKILAMLLALCLMTCACSLAEGTVIEEKMRLAFDVLLEKIPEGVTMERTDSASGVYLMLTSGEAGACGYAISVAPSELFAGYTLSRDVTEEQWAQAEEILTADYSNPSMEWSETAHGTPVIIVSENDAASDFAEIITIWQGYFISVSLLKDSQITEEEMAIGLQLMSDLNVIEE